MARSPDPQKRRQWQERIARFRRAKQTVAEFCAAEGVSPAALYQWKRRLSGEAGADDAVATRDLPGSGSPIPPRFQPVLVTHAAGPRVRLPGGVVIETGDDLQALALVLDRLLGEGNA